MPILNVDLMYSYSKEQKKKLIHDLTASTHELLKIPAEKIIVVLNEYKPDEWGRAGITPEDTRFETLSRKTDMEWEDGK